MGTLRFERPVRVLLVGARGHGRWHLANIERLALAGVVSLVGICDRAPLGQLPTTSAGVATGTDLDDLLARTSPEVVVVCTPMHAHADLAVRCMRSNAHVLLEKPPAAVLAEFRLLERVSAETGMACQVGFQDLASSALPAIRQLLDEGAIGRLDGVGGAGAWVRPLAYFHRAPWAGRRRLGGAFVVDGALTNPFAHAVAAALRVARVDEPSDIRRIEVELYRANPIDADDTSCVRVHATHDVTVTVAVSLCGETNRDPYLVVHGTRGRMVLRYRSGELEVTAPGHSGTERFDRVDLLENLAQHVRDPATPLRVPLRSTASFMHVLEAVRLAPEPVDIAAYSRLEEDERGGHTVVAGVDEAVAASAESLRMFSELGLPWARRAAPSADVQAGPC